MAQLHSAQEAASWLRANVRGALRTDSRQVQAGDGFIAWPGAATDGRAYVGAALKQGAAACLVEHAGVDSYRFDSDAVKTLNGLKAQTGLIAAAYYEQPSQQVKVLAVTGTNGKTSVSWWLAQALAVLPEPLACGVMGTLGVGRLQQLVPTGLTTPDPVVLQQTLRALADAGVPFCALEASSIGIVERRLDGTHIHTALFTNFTQDHLDYHGSMVAYWAAKAELFTWPGLQAAVLNIDDEQGAMLADQLQGLDLWTISCQRSARLQARNITWQQGLVFEVCEGDASHMLRTRLLGDYNVANLLCVIAGLRSLGVPLADAVQACTHLEPVPGRMDCLGGDNAPLAVVDYAHTPDAVAKALQALKNVAAQRQGQLWCVMGCGGDRDPSKRPLMTRAAEQVADQVVLTSDNPRSEDPVHILEQMSLGMRSPLDARVIVDRALAIEKILSEAGPADVVLIAGKGHEDYQDIGGVRHPFSDIEHAQRVLQRLAAQSAQERQ